VTPDRKTLLKGHYIKSIMTVGMFPWREAEILRPSRLTHHNSRSRKLKDLLELIKYLFAM